MNDYEAYGFRASVKKLVNMAELIRAVGEVIGETAFVSWVFPRG